MTEFRQTSFWDPVEPVTEQQLDAAGLLTSPPRQPHDKPQHTSAQGITKKQLEDWSLRLQSAANEAQDDGLYALESDLLDLRDEILFALH
jgi:hypothetical protein